MSMKTHLTIRKKLCDVWNRPGTGNLILEWPSLVYVSAGKELRKYRAMCRSYFQRSSYNHLNISLYISFDLIYVRIRVKHIPVRVSFRPHIKKTSSFKCLHKRKEMIGFKKLCQLKFLTLISFWLILPLSLRTIMQANSCT